MSDNRRKEGGNTTRIEYFGEEPAAGCPAGGRMLIASSGQEPTAHIPSAATPPSIADPRASS